MNEKAAKSLARAVDWLLAQPAADGGWHSQTYGQLKDGAAVTTLVLDALSHFPQRSDARVRTAVQNAFAFLDRGLSQRGTIASPDGSLDFPTYAVALWLTGRRRLKLPPGLQPLRGNLEAQERMLLEYLTGAQLAEGRGFASGSPSYGGWDFLGPKDAQAITTGTNISVARYVLEALVTASAGRDLPGIAQAIERGRAWVLRCRQDDGGFAFTCEPASLNNKAAYADDKLTAPRPYGTATCDGILALLACGLKTDDERIVAAINWLAKRPSLELVPGFEGLPAENGWDRGLRFYYFAGLARVLPHFPATDIQSGRDSLSKYLTGLQRQDGSFVNESDRMRENDPLIATALAVVALASLQG